MKNDIVNVHYAKTHLSRLLERANAGEVIILAKAGKPYARLVPLESEAALARTLGRLEGELEPIDDAVFFDPLPDDELAAWESGNVT